MKAIILAAGKGTRLGKYTEDLPKCMLNFGGKTLIQRQVETLKACGINDISIVKGFKAEKIRIAETKHYLNDDFENTNMVASLFCAEHEIDDEVLICYGDIIYEKRLIEDILESKADIGITVDEDYLEYWKARMENWQDDLETLKVENALIKEVGQKTNDSDSAKLRYIGLIKLSKRGAEILKKIFYENKEKYWDSSDRWMNSKSFKLAYMTDLIQAIINAGYEVEPIRVKKGWMEFDNVEDYEKATKWREEDSLGRFINLDN